MDYLRLSDANIITKKYMDSILIEPRYIDSVKADISFDFLGETFDCPIMMPAFSHLQLQVNIFRQGRIQYLLPFLSFQIFSLHEIIPLRSTIVSLTTKNNNHPQPMTSPAALF